MPANNNECRSALRAATVAAGCSRWAGFTVVELLVAGVVILILLSLLVPGIQLAREAARRTQCRNNLMQIGLALRSYESAHGCLPPGCVDPGRPVQGDGTGYNFGWGVQILPELDLPGL